MIATAVSFFAVMIHWMATLQWHAFQSIRLFLDLTSPDIRESASYQAASCGLGRIFGRLCLCHLLRFTSTLLAPGGMQPGFNAP